MRVLVIVSCIIPNQSVSNVAITNVDERLADYEETVRWAIQDTAFTSIIYVDNSGADLHFLRKYVEIAESLNKQLEILSCQIDPVRLSETGKGYGEGEAVKFVLNNSRLFTCNEVEFFYKITGRLKIQNVNKIINNEDKTSPYFILNYPYHDMLDTRFYGIPTFLYKKYFMDIHNDVNDEQWICLEHVFCQTVQDNKINFKGFVEYPQYIGRSGSTGKDYTNNTNYKLFNFLCRVKLFNSRIVMRLLRILRRLKIIV